ncbi:MAG: hypothetical protein L3J21_02930 [Devosiaceae bacterium]|nr:hypothetical protein [Devosiaceae bacterium]
MSSHPSFRIAHESKNVAAIFTNSINPSSIKPSSFASNRDLASDSARSDSIHLTNWQGGTGKCYSVEEIGLKDFVLSDTSVYLLVLNNRAVWIGGASDLIEDSVSRAQFRQAIKLATAAYKIPCPRHDYQRVGLISDLLAGHLNPKSFAA